MLVTFYRCLVVKTLRLIGPTCGPNTNWQKIKATQNPEKSPAMRNVVMQKMSISQI